ncbi:MAG: hypothetical protein NNA20_11165 [Nitrospira sp.]|nr:hypothetical protein [Nitrospira sp.]
MALQTLTVMLHRKQTALGSKTIYLVQETPMQDARDGEGGGPCRWLGGLLEFSHENRCPDGETAYEPRYKRIFDSIGCRLHP